MLSVRGQKFFGEGQIFVGEGQNFVGGKKVEYEGTLF